MSETISGWKKIRSNAEQDIRDAVVAKLRHWRPNARICHEMNSGSFGPHRFDVVAVDTAEIIAVEIKSERDKLDRAPAQIIAMKSCAHYAIVAVHDRFLEEQKTNKFAAHYERDGNYFLGAVPTELNDAICWVYPEKPRGAWSHQWVEPQKVVQCTLPQHALEMLWRDELCNLCSQLGVAFPKRANRTLLMTALRWNATGSQLTKGICAALRERRFAEADLPTPSILEQLP